MENNSKALAKCDKKRRKSRSGHTKKNHEEEDDALESLIVKCLREDRQKRKPGSCTKNPCSKRKSTNAIYEEAVTFSDGSNLVDTQDEAVSQKEDQEAETAGETDVVSYVKGEQNDKGEDVQQLNDESMEMDVDAEDRPLVIDEVDVGKQVECVNPHCTSGSGLTESPVFVLTYFGVRREKNLLQRVCDACYQLAENHYVQLADMALNKQPLFNANFPKVKEDVVIMDKVDVISDDAPLTEEQIDIIHDNLIEAMEKVWYDCDGDFQLRENKKILKEQIDTIEDKVKQMDDHLKLFDRQLEDINHRIYKNKHVPHQKITFQTEVHIPLEPGQVIHKLTPLSQLPKLPKRPPPSEPERLLPPALIVPPEAKDIVTLAEIAVDKKVPQGEMKYPPLKVGDPVFIVRSSGFGVWLRGRIIKLQHLPNERKMYVAQFDNYKSRCTKLVAGNHLAYTVSSRVAYPVFTRVIALFVDPTLPSRNGYYVGIVAEPQKLLNRFRYLIFFDDGYAQYIEHDHIFPVCEPPQNIWDDVPAACREFIKKYKEEYPERPMVRLQVGMTVKTELGGKWMSSKVENVDASLVKISYDGLNRLEWIYRGSTRLRPLYEKTMMNQKKYHRGLGQNILRMRNLPYVEYKRDEEEPVESTTSQNTNVVQGRNVAKKSTAGKMLNISVTGKLKNISYDYPTKGYIRQMPMDGRLPSKPYEIHECGKSCVDWTNYENLSNKRKLPPLAVPLMSAFTRLLMKGKGKRGIVYTTPCGKNVRNFLELHKYLKTTQCRLGLDLFDFDPWVKVTDEFHLESNMLKIYIEDISDGVENVAISCVNEIYDAWPNLPHYSTRRLPQDGVKLNLDPDFMVCCDCTDDCADKLKCACCLLTMEGMQGHDPCAIPDVTIGYMNRRLPEYILSGIYECHSRCSCSAKTCLNRVVQNPLSQRLQVFRTLNKGWGLRTLNDIPLGAFICIYVGRLLTETSANEDGRAFGDEYLAELDYIEIVEQSKEGYEEDVVEDPADKKSGNDDDDDEEEEEEEEVVPPSARKKIAQDSAYKPSYSIEKFKPTVNTRGAAKRTTNQIDDQECIIISDDEDDVNQESSKFTADIDENKKESKDKPGRKNLREFLGDKAWECYVMDAKSEGNIGRYLNHSCQPNVFVQNVFVDTHDARFPWIAFFALNHIKAGSELTWDYNYNIGSVPGKVLKCYCGAAECRGRLL